MTPQGDKADNRTERGIDGRLYRHNDAKCERGIHYDPDETEHPAACWEPQDEQEVKP